MMTFHLTVVTPDGCAFEGQAERVVCRAIDGDLAILAKHGDYCTEVMEPLRVEVMRSCRAPISVASVGW